MQKTLIIIVLSGILTCVSAAATAQQNGITVTGVNMISTPEGPRLGMTVTITKNAVTNLQGIAVVPALSDGMGNDAKFPYVLVNGKNRSQIYQRHEKFGYEMIEENPPYLVMNIDPKHPGGKVDYSAPIKGEAWMANASLSLAFVLVSPAGEMQSYSTAVTATSVVTIPEAATISSPPMVVETMPQPPVTAQIPPVVATPPEPVAPPVVPVGTVLTVSGSADIDFEAASSSIMPLLGRNSQILAAVDDTIGRISSTAGAVIVAITITGYSSPDGRYETNASLAWDRALAFSGYLQARLGVPATIVKARAVGEDWSGLRAAVAGNQRSWPSGVLEIIDSADAPDAKESRLRRMSGGAVWRRMEGEIFPRLRKIDYSIDYMIAGTGTPAAN